MGRKKQEPDKAIPIYFPKDNNLISSKSEMTLIGRKVFDACIMHVQTRKDKDGDTEIYAELSGQELQAFLGKRYGSQYDTIKQLLTRKRASSAPSLLDWKIIVCNDEKEEIEVSNIITDGRFKNGSLKVIFNKSVKDRLIGYKNNYTMLDRTIISGFTSNYSYQLYQIFKKTIDRERAITKEAGPFELDFDLVDLKVQLGVVAADTDNILYKAVTDNSVVTYDEIEKIDDKELVKKLQEYGDFRRYAIETAKKEINKISDITMDYEKMTKGRGGKGVGFKFFIKYKEQVNPSDESSVQEKEVDLFDFIDEMREVFSDISLPTKDMKAIAEASDFDMQKIKTAYCVMKSIKGGVDNPTGFLIKAIKENYKAPSSVQKGKGKNAFNDFPQNKYNFKELEKRLVDN